MKHYFFMPILSLFGGKINGQTYQNNPREFELQESDTLFTMKKHVKFLLKPGPKRSQSKKMAVEIQKGHLEHILALRERW